jgi:hypothetical protein
MTVSLFGRFGHQPFDVHSCVQAGLGTMVLPVVWKKFRQKLIFSLLVSGLTS